MEFQGTTYLYHQTADLTLLNALRQEIAENEFRRVSVCSAFATRKGVTQIRSLMPEGSKFRWILGLDDAFTEPGALTCAADAFNSTLRTVELRKSTLRPLFHPKIYFLDDGREETSSIVVGSANLTNAALTRNCEAFSITRVEGIPNIRRAERYWNKFWKRATVFDSAMLDAYRARHKRAKRRNAAFPEDSSEHNAGEMRQAINLAAQTANLVWFEIGGMTGYQGQQLDIPKDLLPFLRAPAIYHQGDEHTIWGESETGRRQYVLRYYKQMWRFMDIQQAFNTSLKEPDEAFSRYILTIARRGASYRLNIIVRGGSADKELSNKGFSSATTKRRYGWT